MPQYEELSCQFCGKGRIQVLYFPESRKFYKASWGGSKPGWKKTRSETFIIQNGCSNCGKLAEEIDKKLNK